MASARSRVNARLLAIQQLKNSQQPLKMETGLRIAPRIRITT
jgi:hypothetical protein